MSNHLIDEMSMNIKPVQNVVVPEVFMYVQ